jgi:putative spermidine/putrescine transport system permease protein
MMAKFFSKRTPGEWGVTIAAWLVLLYLLLPLFVVIAISFTTTQYLSFPPVGFTLKWYHDFLSEPSYVGSILLSVKLAFGATLGGFLLGVPAALVLHEGNFRGAELLRNFFLSPLILPGLVIGVGILQITSALGFSRSFPAMVIGHVVLVMPYIVRTTLSSLSGFDRSLAEAAMDLGASRFSTFFLVTFAIIKPGIVAGCLFALIMSWIDVEVSIFNTVVSQSPISVNIFNYVQYNVDPTIAAVSAATVYIAFIFVILLDKLVGFERATVGK